MIRKRSLATLFLAVAASFALGTLWAQATMPTVTVTCTKPTGGGGCVRLSPPDPLRPSTCIEYASVSYACEVTSKQQFSDARRVTLQ